MGEDMTPSDALPLAPSPQPSPRARGEGARRAGEGEPSTNTTTREELHFRRIDMRGYRRSDGLFEVEGRVTDRKPHDFTPFSGGRQVPAGAPVHDMGVRLVYDDKLRVHDVHTLPRPHPRAAPKAAAHCNH